MNITEQEFWNIIEQSKAGVENSPKPRENKLVALLKERGKDACVDFDKMFQVMKGRLNTWDLWAVAFIVNGGCGDDSFMDFRAWVVSQGKELYDQALREPQKVADHPGVKDSLEWETFGYAAQYAYEQLTGESATDAWEWDEQEMGSQPDEPTGEPWDEDDLEELYPELCARFMQ